MTSRRRSWDPIFVAIFAVALVGSAWGIHGLILPLDLLVATRGVATLTGTQQVFGVAVRRSTLGEFLVCGAMCYVLHALAIPGVSI